MQSIYRVEIDEEIRPYTDRYGNVHYYGNYISNGEISKEGYWKNFLTGYAFDYAKKRVNPENKKPYETIESDRLFNNLLSSQPKVIKAALPNYPIHKVTEVELEFIPKEYKELTGDKSAMDAIIRFEDEHGKNGFIATGADDTFRLAWKCARPNAIVTVVALYDKPQILPLPEMYGKNLTFKTGGVDGCDCEEVLHLIEQGKIDTPLITHCYPLSEIEEAYRVFENKEDGVIKVAIIND